MSDKSDFERFWKSKPHLKAYEPMAAAWQAWQAARALEGGDGDSPVMEYHNSPSGMHVVWETLPYGKHLLYIHPSASVPEGWNIEMIGDEIRIDTPDDAHFQFARDSRMPNHALPNMLYDLGSALLTTPTPATTPQPADKCSAWPCWNCKSKVSMDERGEADGDCPKCGAELDLDLWPNPPQEQ